MTAGSLLTQFFLQDGIRQTEAYRELTAGAVEASQARLAEQWRRFTAMRDRGPA